MPLLPKVMCWVVFCLAWFHKTVSRYCGLLISQLESVMGPFTAAENEWIKFFSKAFKWLEMNDKKKKKDFQGCWRAEVIICTQLKSCWFSVFTFFSGNASALFKDSDTWHRTNNQAAINWVDRPLVGGWMVQVEHEILFWDARGFSNTLDDLLYTTLMLPRARVCGDRRRRPY